MTKEELINIILMGSVFVLVLSAWGICVTLWLLQYLRRRRQLRNRLGLVDPETDRSRAYQIWLDDRRRGTEPRAKSRLTIGRRLELLRAHAGWKSPAHVVILAIVGLTVLLFAALFMLGYDMWITSAVGAGVIIAFWIMTKRRIAAREAQFERQLVDALGIAARALRAGHPLSGSFQLVSEEIGEPVGQIFGDICQEQSLGLDLRESLQRVAGANDNPDLKLFATAIGIQLRTGGNLAELMDTLAGVMRVRIQLHRRVRVLTAQAHMSRQILTGLPIFMFVLMNFLAPEYMVDLYGSWLGRALLAIVAVNIVIGSWVMAKLSVLRY